MPSRMKEISIISDIDMDNFGQSSYRLATTGVSTCVGFIVFLDNSEGVFLEHRSDLFLPTTINLETVRLCFKNIAKHISNLFPTSAIT